MICRLSIAFVFLATALAASMTGAQAPKLETMDIVERSVPAGPVALVDGRAVSREAFIFLYRQQLSALRMMQPNKEIPDSVRVMTALQVLRELVQREVLATEAPKLGVTVSDAELEEAYQAEMKGLQEVFQKEGRTMSEADILTEGKQTREEALEALRKEILASKTKAAIAKGAGIEVPESEIKRFYEENSRLFNRPGNIHLKQIFIRPEPNGKDASPAAWEAAEKEINTALARIRAGESFEAVAKAMSDAPDAERGGDIGPQPAANLPAFYVAPAQQMSPGALSEIIKSDNGYHIIKLVESTSGGTLSLDDARQRIKAILMRERGEEVVDAYADPLINDPDRVRIYLQLEKSLATLESEQPNGAS